MSHVTSTQRLLWLESSSEGHINSLRDSEGLSLELSTVSSQHRDSQGRSLDPSIITSQPRDSYGYSLHLRVLSIKSETLNSGAWPEGPLILTQRLWGPEFWSKSHNLSTKSLLGLESGPESQLTLIRNSEGQSLGLRDIISYSLWVMYMRVMSSQPRDSEGPSIYKWALSPKRMDSYG